MINFEVVNELVKNGEIEIMANHGFNYSREDVEVLKPLTENSDYRMAIQLGKKNGVFIVVHYNDTHTKQYFIFFTKERYNKNHLDKLKGNINKALKIMNLEENKFNDRISNLLVNLSLDKPNGIFIIYNQKNNKGERFSFQDGDYTDILYHSNNLEEMLADSEKYESKLAKKIETIKNTQKKSIEF